MLPPIGPYSIALPVAALLMASRVASAATLPASAAPGAEARVDQARRAYAASCAMCHGDRGEGLVAPAIRPLPVTLAEARAIVRAGRGEMPAIPSAQLSDPVLSLILADLANSE